MIECKFREIPEHPFLTNQTKTKLGRYHQSAFGDVEDGYIIGAYIDGDFKKQLKKITEEELIEECISFLNSIMGRKSKKKKVPKCIYGTLKNYKCVVKKDINKKIYIEALLISDEKNNNHFWGEGKIKEKGGREGRKCK